MQGRCPAVCTCLREREDERDLLQAKRAIGGFQSHNSYIMLHCEVMQRSKSGKIPVNGCEV